MISQTMYLDNLNVKIFTNINLLFVGYQSSQRHSTNDNTLPCHNIICYELIHLNSFKHIITFCIYYMQN